MTRHQQQGHQIIDEKYCVINNYNKAIIPFSSKLYLI